MTFSIVARDEQTGQIGVAVQTHWFAVGAICPWIEAGVGAVATQSMVEISYGPKGLDLLREGRSPQEALEKLLAEDKEPGLRQIAIVDNLGRIAVHTGDRCIQAAGHSAGEWFFCSGQHDEERHGLACHGKGLSICQRRPGKPDAGCLIRCPGGRGRH